MPWGSLVYGSVFFPGRARMRRRNRGTTREDYDAIECFFIFLPLIPLRPVHVWNWGPEETTGTGLSAVRTAVYSFRAMPIRWSPYLVVRALLRYWLWPPTVVGLLFSLSCVHGLLFRLAAFALLLASLGAWLALAFLDIGQPAIRRLLGRHRLGVSDPATWTEDLVRLLAPPQEWFGTPTFAEAVDLLLQQRRYSEAMWAARLCLVTESESEGRTLTGRVLSDPEVRAVVAQIKSHPGRFQELAHRQQTHELPLVRP